MRRFYHNRVAQRGMVPVCGVLRTALWVVLLVTAGGCANRGELTQAQETLGQYKQELERFQTTAAPTDQAGVLAARQRLEELLQTARRQFEEAGVARSLDRNALMAYAEVLTTLGDDDRAADALRRTVRIYPNDAQAWRALGRSLIMLGPTHGTEAVQALRQVLTLKTSEIHDVALAHSLLARVYSEQRLNNLAREQLQLALETDPDLTLARIRLIALDVRDGDLGTAQAALEELREPKPEEGALLQSELSKALHDFEEARLPLPEDAASHLAYGRLLVRAGRVEDSLWPLERAVKLNPSDYGAWNTLGGVAQGLGKPARAREAYERSLQINPDQPRTREYLDALNAPASAAPQPPAAAPGVVPTPPAQPPAETPNAPTIE